MSDIKFENQSSWTVIQVKVDFDAERSVAEKNLTVSGQTVDADSVDLGSRLSFLLTTWGSHLDTPFPSPISAVKSEVHPFLFFSLFSFFKRYSQSLWIP